MMDADSTPSPAEPLGLRERRRRETERELSLAALELFERNGVSGTTVDDIAAAAGVSARTFFRYADTKEHALFLADHEFVAVTERALRGIREGRSVVAALETGWLPLLEDFDARSPGERERTLRIRGLVIAEPSLLSVALARDERDAEVLVAAIVAAPDAMVEGRALPKIDELHARALVTIVGATVRVAFDEWTRRAERGVDASVRDLYSELRRDLAASFSDVDPL